MGTVTRQMGKSLVIVESPAKAKTISKILGKDYQVKASIGHIRDLPRNKLGVNVRKNFEPEYEILRDKEPIVAELREAEREADIDSFNPQQYWSIKAELTRARAKQSFTAALYKYDGKRIIAATDKETANSSIIDSEEMASKIVKALEKADYKVTSVSEKS